MWFESTSSNRCMNVSTAVSEVVADHFHTFRQSLAVGLIEMTGRYWMDTGEFFRVEGCIK